MTLAEKIKYLRKKRGMTQQDLAGDFMTRNMLSQIERGAALPSMPTLEHLSKKLSVDPSVFFENGKTIERLEQEELLAELKDHYSKKQYSMCIRLVREASFSRNTEFAMILYDCYYNEGVTRFNASDFAGSLQFFSLAEDFEDPVSFPSFHHGKIGFYKELISSFGEGMHLVSASLFASLSSDDDGFAEYFMYTYLMSLIDNNQSDRAILIYDTIRLKDEGYRIHINARLAASRFNYERAKELLLSVVQSEKEYPAPFLYNVFKDLERYCKALEDYETAYYCATIREKYSYKSPVRRHLNDG